MTKYVLAFAAATAVAGITSIASAAPLYTENFDVDASANWTWSSSIAADGANNDTGNEYNPFFDYSTVGIPSAPNSAGTTRGLKLEA